MRHAGGSGDCAGIVTRFSLHILRTDPHASANFIRAKYDLSKPCVIEGVRNAFDLPLLFDPRTDFVIFVDHLFNRLKPTDFEFGIRLMAAQLEHLCELDVMDPERVVCYKLVTFRKPPVLPGLVRKLGAVASRLASSCGDSFETRCVLSLEEARDDILDRVAATNEGELQPGLNSVHADTPRIQTCVRAEYLHGMNADYVGQYYPCRIFAVSSYIGSTPTFKIMLTGNTTAEDDICRGSVFSFIPASALVNPAKLGTSLPVLELSDLVYHNSKEGRICVNSFEALAGPVQAYFAGKDLWLPGEYIFTIDWYDGNDLLHLVSLESGQYAMLPHHKLKFGAKAARKFAPFKKIKTNWQVQANERYGKAS